jgi:tetratricopeptide (TPR) repeat protein
MVNGGFVTSRGYPGHGLSRSTPTLQAGFRITTDAERMPSTAFRDVPAFYIPSSTMPQRPRSHQLEEESARAFRAALPTQWVIRKVDPDYGIDCAVEIFDADGRATALSFSVQLKGTDEPDLAAALGGVRFRRETAEYYREQTLPVLIVRYHAPTGRLFARWFHAYNPHIARRGLAAGAQSVRFQFYENDEVGADFTERTEAGLRGYLKFRSPELRLPLRVAITPTVQGASPDAHRAAFALRRVLESFSDLVAFEVRNPAPDDPSITLERNRAVVSLADVASVTLDREIVGDEGTDAHAGDVTLALCVALTFVGQANLASQLAAVAGPRATVITDPEVSFAIAGAMFRSQRIREAIQLADDLDASDDEDVRLSAFVLLTALLAKQNRLQPDERELALAASERRLNRRAERGDLEGLAAEAYNLGMLHKRLAGAEPAIQRFRQAAEHDPTYTERGYYHVDLAGALFEHGDFEAAAHHYGQAVELGEGGLTHALLADALLFSGRYADARHELDRYLATQPGPEGAEWRLKRKTVDLLIEAVGKRQDRDQEVADAILSQWDFEKAPPEMTPQEAEASCWRALEHDACSSEAWFRLGLIAIFPREEPTEGGPASVAGAVLRRYGIGH